MAAEQSSEGGKDLVSLLKPRQYQHELFQEARLRNVVVYLDTGSGKTLISVLLIKEKSHELQQAEKKVTVFLAPRVALVQQQGEVLRKHLDLRIKYYYGEMNVDCWNKAEWLKEWNNHDVMLMTPQILLDILRHGFITMTQINLLIFDEAHHCVKKNPYNCIMSEFYHDPRHQGARPHILGMTASPVNVKNMNSLAQLQATMMDLERNLNAKVLSVSDREELDRYAPLPNLHVEKFSRTRPEPVTVKAIDDLMAVHAELQAVAAEEQQKWDAARLRMLGVIDTDRNFDKERHSTFGSTMAKNIMGVLKIIEELGPLCAAAAFAEIIKPPQHNTFLGRQREVLRTGRLETLDGTFMETEDSWFNGMHPMEDHSEKQAHAAERESRSDKGRDKHARVNQLLAAAADILADTIVPHQHQLNPKEEIVPPQSLAFRRKISERLQAVIKQLPPATLDEHVTGKLGPQEAEWEPPCRLVTHRVRKLAFKLLSYKAAAEGSKASEQQQSTSQGWCCIIFVGRKMSSMAINAVLCMTPALQFLASSRFMGYGGSTSGTSLNAKEQVSILARFRAGQLNCLVSTSVAEEGLDVPQCQLVIRFDLPSSLLAFVQSRGRARMVSSDMVFMVDQHSPQDLAFLDNALAYEQQMKDEVRRRQEQGGAELDDLPLDLEMDEAKLLQQQIDALPLEQRELYVPSTGAKITHAAAKQRLYYFCDKLPSDRYTQLRPRFSTEDTPDGGSVTEVLLPNNSPVRSARGHAMPKRALAASSACLEALKLLYQAGALSKHLQPETVDGILRSEAEKEEEDRKLGVSESKPGSDSTEAAKELKDKLDLTQGPQPEPEVDLSGACIRSKVPDILQIPAELKDHPGCSPKPGPSTVQLHLYHFQLEVVGQPKGTVAPNLGQPFGILTLQELPAFPAFDMLLPRGFSLSPDSADQDAPGTQASVEGFYGHEKDAAAKMLRTRVCVSVPPLGCQTFSTDQVGLLQCWHRAFCKPKFMADEREKAKSKADDKESIAKMVRTKYAGPEEWAASSHGAYYLLAPMDDGSQDCADIKSIDWSTVAKATRGYEPVLTEADILQASYQGLDERLLDAVLITTYNRWVYFHQRVDWDTRLGDSFETDKLASKRVKEDEGVDDQTQSVHIGLSTKTGKSQEQAIHEKASRKDAAAFERLTQAIAKTDDAGNEPGEVKSVTYEEYFWERWHVKGLKRDQPLLEALHQGRGLQGSAGGKKPIPSTMTGRKRPFAELFADDNSKFSFVLLPPQLCQLHPLTQNAFLAARLAPHLVWWFLGLLRAMELREHFVHPALTPDLVPDTMLMMEAVMSKSCHELISYETLETLGDAFLKFAVSVHLYRLFPLAHEGQLTLRKMAVISNTNLARVGDRLGLTKYHAMPLDTDCWHPAGLPDTVPVKEKGIKPKVLADGVEAMLGAYLISGGLKGAIALLAAFRILPIPADFDYPNSSACNQSADDAAVGLLNAKDAEIQRLRCKGPERHLRYSFHDKSLLMEAFTHCSWPDPNPPCYQRLEFVGDAVLDLLITRAIVTGFRRIPPGRIHDLRSASVNNGRLACIAVTQNLHCYLRQCSASLFNHISEFVTSFRTSIDAHQQSQRDAAATPQKVKSPPGAARQPALTDALLHSATTGDGQEQSESAADADERLLDNALKASNGSEPPANTCKEQLMDVAKTMDTRTAAYNWATSAAFGRSEEAPPKALGDLLESVTGAVYVDCGCDLETAWKVIGPMMQPMVTPSTVPIHPIRALHEKCQRFGLELEYRSCTPDRPGTMGMEALVKTVIIGRCGAALNKQLGRKGAAADGLRHWDKRVKPLIAPDKLESAMKDGIVVHAPSAY